MREPNLSLAHPMVTLQQGKGVLGYSRDYQPANVHAFLAEIADLARKSGVVGEMFDCGRRNLKAKISVRAPADNERGYDYELIDDGPTQLTAVRVLAELLHLTQKGTVNINSTDNRVQISLGDQMAELMSVGGPGPDELEVEVKEAFARIRASTAPTDAPKQLEQGAAGGF